MSVSGGNVIVQNGQLNVSEGFYSDSDTFYIDSENNLVGIGTTSPGQKLDVAGIGEFDYGVVIDRNGASSYLYLKRDGAGVAQVRALSTDSIGFSDASGNQKMVVNVSTGNVGIGTTSPEALLHVMTSDASAVSSENSVLTLEKNDHAFLQLLSPNDKWNGIYFGDPEDNQSGELSYDQHNDRMFFGTNGSFNKMVLDVQGRLGIGGMLSPSEKLHVNGSLRVDNSTGSAVFLVNGTSGNVGIGVTLLRTKLHIDADVNAETTLNSWYGVGAMHLTPVSWGQGARSGISFGGRRLSDGWSPTIALITAENADDNGYTGVLKFYTRSGGGFIDAGGFIARMTITSSGNVGIGTTSPDAPLHVVGSGSDINPNINGVHITGNDSSGNAGIELTSHGGTPYIDFQNDTNGTDFDIRVKLMGDDSLAIEGGNVGIGTTIPLAGLQVRDGQFGVAYNDYEGILLDSNAYGSGTFSPAVGFGYNGAIDAAIAGTFEGADNNQMGLAFFVHPSTTGVDDKIEAMRIDESGYVGVGTSTPGEILDIYGSGALKIRINSSNTNDVAIWLATANDGNSTVLQQYQGRFRIYDLDANTERITLLDNGSLGINTTSPQAVLDVNGDSRFGCRAGFWSLGDGRLCMESTMRGPNYMHDAIAACKSVSPGCRICEHNDFQQACGAGYAPYGGQSQGWYGDHGVASGGNWDDEFGTWNTATCADNNDGAAFAASSLSTYYRCCY